MATPAAVDYCLPPPAWPCSTPKWGYSLDRSSSPWPYSAEKAVLPQSHHLHKLQSAGTSFLLSPMLQQRPGVQSLSPLERPAVSSLRRVIAACPELTLCILGVSHPLTASHRSSASPPTAKALLSTTDVPPMTSEVWKSLPVQRLGGYPSCSSLVQIVSPRVSRGKLIISHG